MNRLNFSTPFSTNAVSIFHAVGIRKITRVERSTRYLIRLNKEIPGHKAKSLEDKVRYNSIEILKRNFLHIFVITNVVIYK